MRSRYFFLLMMVFLMSCVPTKFNQYSNEGKIRKRDGKWIESNSTEQGNYVSKGKYRKGIKVGVWKTSINGIQFQKDSYRKDLIKTKIFHSNGKVKIKGQSKTEITDDYIHWFYAGDWKHYNEKGKLIYIKKYNRGKPADSVSYHH